MPFITDPPPPPPPPPDPPPTEMDLLRDFAATLRGLYERGGHINRSDVKAALDRLPAAP